MFRKKYHAAIYNAIDDGIINRDFTQRITITGTTKRTRLDKVRMLSVDDIERLIKLAKSRRRITQKADATNLKGNISDYVILTMILTGMRIGECLALKWHNLHYDTSTIDIHHEYESDSHHLGPTKTPSSYRTITVNSQLLDILKELKVNHTDYVFGVSQRKLPPARNSVDHELIRMMKMLNIPTDAFSNHMLRHAHVALLLHWGASIYEIRDRMGHSNITTTLNTYGYLISESKHENTKLITDNFSKFI
ncbi:site-specific integrase [Lactobacillus xujianguonis]|uniref:Site-specific integrase n=2 Tax=Lactobacillus TaxID=1578 RepID=A0A437SYC7_9LACO|nr:site-specific integrase [Lactobacillus xujianguonis]RVU71817.1 site-specific integrase [Lactobacillus xujianguonis]